MVVEEVSMVKATSLSESLYTRSAVTVPGSEDQSTSAVLVMGAPDAIAGITRPRYRIVIVWVVESDTPGSKPMVAVGNAEKFVV